MNYKYKGSTPVKERDRVYLVALDEDGEPCNYDEAIVIDTLAKQFTCRIPYRKQVRYYFYEDEGLTWKKVP